MTDSKADKSTIIQNLHFHISSAADIHAALNSIAKARDIDLKGVSISIDDSVQTSTKAAQDPVPLTSSSSSSSKKKSKRWLKMKEWFKHRDAQMKQSSGGKSNNKVTKSSSSLGAMVFGIRRAHWDRFEKALEMFPGESMCIITNLVSFFFAIHNLPVSCIPPFFLSSCALPTKLVTDISFFSVIE